MYLQTTLTERIIITRRESIVDFFVYAMKNTVLCIRYFSNTKHKLREKNTGQCFSIELQFTCKTSDKSEKNQKRPKIRHKAVMHPALQFLPGIIVFDVRRTHTICTVTSFWMLCNFRVWVSSWTGLPLASISCKSFESRLLSEFPWVDSLWSGCHVIFRVWVPSWTS